MAGGSTGTSSAAALQVALDDAGKVLKKQKTCEERTHACVDQLISLVAAARAQVAASGGSPQVIRDLQEQVKKLGLEKEMTSQTKELHTAVGKLSKSIDAALEGSIDVTRALRSTRFDSDTLNSVIAEHFYREGRFEIGDAFAREAGVSDASALKAPYADLHRVLERLRARDLAPALAWAEAHRAALAPGGGPSQLEFSLHALAFVELLLAGGGNGGDDDGDVDMDGGGGIGGGGIGISSGEGEAAAAGSGGGAAAALAYAKRHFPPFRATRMADIQRHMACILFAGRPAAAVPPQYAALLAPGPKWAAVEAEFTKQACSLLGQASESPLAVAAAAGAAALPALVKMANVMARSGVDYDACEQLPADLSIGREFVFHSVFACPVSKDQSTPENPPKLLPCGHVLCEQSIAKIADRSRTRVFKCPYCPMEARADNARALVFPDPIA